jgi:hypothetical protein
MRGQERVRLASPSGVSALIAPAFFPYGHTPSQQSSGAQ